MTDFQQKVFEALTEIPEGMVTTYKLMAEHLGHNARAAISIGQVLKKNQDIDKYPCHRVIKTDLSIGGYFGKTEGDNINKKLELLKEGIEFNDGILVDKSKIYKFQSS